MAAASCTKNLTILVFGNPNSGKADVLTYISHTKPTNNGFVLSSHSAPNGDMELKLSRQRLTCRILNSSSEGDKGKAPSSPNDNTAILFVANVADYDQLLPEDKGRNRLQADLDLFDSVANSAQFKTTPIIILLNNVDKFQEKLSTVPMRDFFSDYMDGPTYLSDVAYVVDRFVSRSPRAGNQIYVHAATGSEMTALDFLIQTVEDIV